MKSLYFFALLQIILVGAAVDEGAPPNPYEIFAEEQPSVYRIRTNQSSRVKGDSIPDLSQRPAALRPGPIPADVRYSFTADSLMADAAVLLTSHFCSSPTEETLPISKTLVVHPGSWIGLKQTGLLGRKSATP